MSTTPARHARRSGFHSIVRDFTLIVAGVLTALALESWNSSRSERRLEDEYVQALAHDVRAHIAHYDGWLSTLERHRGWTATIWGWANGAAPAPEQPVEEVLLWVRLGGQVNLNTHLQNGAYQDLVSSGRLALIRDRALRASIVAYHNSVARWNGIIEANGAAATARYAEAHGGVVPPDVAWRALAGEKPSEAELRPILAEFGSRPALQHALVGMAESHEFRMHRAQQLRRQAEELLALLESRIRAPSRTRGVEKS